jgi:hypothetical protein
MSSPSTPRTDAVRSKTATEIVIPKDLSLKFMGSGMLGLAVVLLYFAWGLDWSENLHQPNIVELLYVNALPILGLLVWLVFVGMGVACWSQDVIQVDAERSRLIYRLRPPLQPVKNYNLGRFHTVRVNVVTTQRRSRAFQLEVFGGEVSLMLSEPDEHSACEHAEQLAEACRLGFQGRPLWEVPDRSLQRTTAPKPEPQPLGDAVRVECENGFDVVFSADVRWRWLFLLPYLALMASSWWAMTPWYIYLLWTVLVGVTMEWFRWKGEDHTFSVRGTRCSYTDHGGEAVYEVNLSTQNYLELKGDDIVCATPSSYLVLALPRASRQEKEWIRNELLQRVCSK